MGSVAPRSLVLENPDAQGQECVGGWDEPPSSRWLGTIPGAGSYHTYISVTEIGARANRFYLQ